MAPDLLCFSHLRWDFVYQRPNHLMARAARDRRVFFVEEPEIVAQAPDVRITNRDGLHVVRPLLPDGLSPGGQRLTLELLIRELVEGERIQRPWLWYYTAMALPWSRDLESSAVIYDCMDELSAFRGAPHELLQLEDELLKKADVVFTGGRSLWEAKVDLHPRVHAMPSAVDVGHFRQARQPGRDPSDQAAISRPRIGYYGVIDERIDGDLIRAVAAARPEWQIVLVGPTAKLSPDEIPTGPNVHNLGLKHYEDLPDYVRGWDVAIMPFAINEATRYISPTKTPEYLAAGRPVVSTPIRDVVEPYGRLEVVRIADKPESFVEAIEQALVTDRATFLPRADSLLAEMSWDRTWNRMQASVADALAHRPAVAPTRRARVATRLAQAG
jgi:glycosyltransferase involved in cell wall biosynthesis